MKKTINLSSAQSLFAQDRESIEEAFPGDVIGLHNPGHFAIGDTIFTGSKRISYPGIPSFSPEKFAYIRNPNPSTYKKFQKVNTLHYEYVYTLYIVETLLLNYLKIEIYAGFNRTAGRGSGAASAKSGG